MTWEQLKAWLKEKENKNKIVLAICFVLVFLVGFGAGSFQKAARPANPKSISNYTTNSSKAVKTADMPATDTITTTAAAPVVAGTSTANGCLIKGNINSKGDKIYHIPGGASYKIVKPEQCFSTEAEAVAAGFRKAGR